MAVDMFLKIDGVTGESKDAKHSGEIDVVSWSWGVSNSGTAHTGGGAGAGKANVQNVSITKYVDKATTDLLLFCCSGKHPKQSVLTIRKSGEQPLEYLTIKMSNCLVTSVSTGATSGDKDMIKEQVTINFAQIEVAYTPQKSDGSGDAPTQMGWDIAGNTKI